jgi:hypothetical protein
MAKDTKDTKNDEALKALQIEALQLAEKLSQRVDVENIEAMGLEQLTELVSGLKARVAEGPKPPKPAASAPQGSGAELVGDRWFVAPGRISITCKRGVMGPGDEVFASDFSDGAKALERLSRKSDSGKGPYLVKS